MRDIQHPGSTTRRPWWPALAAWATSWTVLLLLDRRIDIANLALLLVLGSAVAAIWSAGWVSLAASGLAVLAFNVAFVPPRGAFTVDIRQHALLLFTMLAVSWIVTLLVARLRWHAAQATAHALRAVQQRELGEALRTADGSARQASALREALATLCHGEATLLLPGEEGATPWFIGPAAADEAIGLRQCWQDNRAMGPGTGLHEEQPGWYLPLRGLHGAQGAALVRHAPDQRPLHGLLPHARALCDQLGLAFEQAAALKAATKGREQAQAQALRNTLLTAISHDHRTPLATILSASSALHDQGDRLSPPQRQRLAATIVDEATQLSRLTDNTLQLARLGATPHALSREWESVEEMVGTVLRRLRQRAVGHRVKTRLEAALPLLRCDAVLIVQLLDNLVDNALKHGGVAHPIEVLARRQDACVLIAVRDRGPGVPLGQREVIFDTFQRGDPAAGRSGGDVAPRAGAGVGLALCRAIALAHGGELRLRARSHGGSSFELRLPMDTPPDDPPRDDLDGGLS